MKKKTELPTRDWRNATWEGSRRAQLRRALQLTARERLEKMIELNETSAALKQLNASAGVKLPTGAGNSES